MPVWRATRSAWTVLSRRVVLLSVLAAGAGFAALSTVVTVTTATTDTDGPSPPGASIKTLAELARPDGIMAGLGGAATFLGIVAIVLAASTMASDVQLGTLRALLVRQPERRTFLAGKALAVSGLLAAAALLAGTVSTVVALSLAGGQGVDTGAWTAAEALSGVGRTMLAMMGYGVLGLALGVLLGSPTAAIGVGVGWVLAVEQVLHAAWADGADLLPGRLLSALADGTIDAARLAVLGAWLVLAASVAVAVFTRRDVRA